MVVDGDRQDFLDLVLPDDILVQIGFHFRRRDEIRHVDSLEIALSLLRDGILRVDHGAADVDAFAAYGDTAVRGVDELDFRIGTSAEGAILF